MRSNHGLLQAIRTGGGEGGGSGGSIKASCNRNAAPRVNKSITRERGGGLAIASGLTRGERRRSRRGRCRGRGGTCGTAQQCFLRSTIGQPANQHSPFRDLVNVRRWWYRAVYTACRRNSRRSRQNN